MCVVAVVGRGGTSHLRAESGLRVEESAAELAVLSGGDEALSLRADAARPADQRTRHVAQIGAARRQVLRLGAYLSTHADILAR